MSSGERELLRKQVPTPAPVTGPGARVSGGPHAPDVLGLQRRAGNQAVARMLTQVHQRQIQRVPIAGVDVTSSGGYPSWTWDGKAYHFNMRYPDSLHITEDVARNHYYVSIEHTYVKGQAVTEFTDLVGVGHHKKGGIKGEKKGTRKRYSQLPGDLRDWFETNYARIIGVS